MHGPAADERCKRRRRSREVKGTPAGLSSIHFHRGTRRPSRLRRYVRIQEPDEKIVNSDQPISESLEGFTEKPFNAIQPHRKLSRTCVQELLAGLLSSHEVGCLVAPVRPTTDVSGPSNALQGTGIVLRRVATSESVAEILFASKPQRAELSVATRLRRNYTIPQRRVGGMVTQRIANPCIPVRFRYSPPYFPNSQGCI